jgi:glutamate--cysteine ligase
MSREVLDSNAQPINSLDDLLSIFVQGGRGVQDFGIGMEFERFLVDQKTNRALPYEGPRGIQAFLLDLANTNGWNKVYDLGSLVSLHKGDTAITLEPGGQVEISCQTHCSMKKLSDELSMISDQLNQAASKLDAVFVARGIHPTESVESSPWMPKSRYRFMKDYYTGRSRAALEMMVLTSSIQVNFDYINEEDARKKVLISSFLVPILSAVFANSAVERSHLNGFVTRRIPIWQNMDPARSGIPEFFVDGTFSFEKYRDYALDVPMYFVLRNGQYLDSNNMTFRQFIESKSEKFGPATLGDWEFHLTTLFPEVRLKNHLEFRPVDSNPVEYVLALGTFWKGLFHDSLTVGEWYEFFRAFTREQLLISMKEVSKVGLKANLGSYSVLEIARKLFSDAQENFSNRPRISDEAKYLKPMGDILDRGMSSAEAMIKAFPAYRPL